MQRYLPRPIRRRACGDGRRIMSRGGFAFTGQSLVVPVTGIYSVSFSAIFNAAGNNPVPNGYYNVRTVGNRKRGRVESSGSVGILTVQSVLQKTDDVSRVERRRRPRVGGNRRPDRRVRRETGAGCHVRFRTPCFNLRRTHARYRNQPTRTRERRRGRPRRSIRFVEWAEADVTRTRTEARTSSMRRPAAIYQPVPQCSGTPTDPSRFAYTTRPGPVTWPSVLRPCARRVGPFLDSGKRERRSNTSTRGDALMARRRDPPDDTSIGVETEGCGSPPHAEPLNEHQLYWFMLNGVGERGTRRPVGQIRIRHDARIELPQVSRRI